MAVGFSLDAGSTPGTITGWASGLGGNPAATQAAKTQAAKDATTGLITSIFDTGQSKAYQTQAEADLGEANQYDIAAGLALSNVNLEREATSLEQYKNSRAAIKAIGGQQADVATAGFKMAGSNL